MDIIQLIKIKIHLLQHLVLTKIIMYINHYKNPFEIKKLFRRIEAFPYAVSDCDLLPRQYVPGDNYLGVEVNRHVNKQ